MGPSNHALRGHRTGRHVQYGNHYSYNRVYQDGSNSWVLDPKIRNQKWIELADETSNVTVATILDDFSRVTVGCQLPSAIER